MPVDELLFEVDSYENFPGYAIGWEHVPVSESGAYNMGSIAFLRQNLSSKPLFDIVAKRQNGFGIQNIIGAVHGSNDALWEGGDETEIEDRIVIGQLDEEFTGLYNYFKNLTIDLVDGTEIEVGLDAAEAFSIAFILYDADKRIREIPGYPHEPIVYKDIIPMLYNSNIITQIAETQAYILEKAGIEYDGVLGNEARGWVLATELAAVTGKPLALIRKKQGEKDKLPRLEPDDDMLYEVTVETYDGPKTFQIENLEEYDNQRWINFDDVVGTSGSTKGARHLAGMVGANIILDAYLIGVPEGYREDRLPGILTLLNQYSPEEASAIRDGLLREG